jgi:hypothetical protein
LLGMRERAALYGWSVRQPTALMRLRQNVRRHAAASHVSVMLMPVCVIRDPYETV